jgi:hypothetical protein
LQLHSIGKLSADITISFKERNAAQQGQLEDSRGTGWTSKTIVWGKTEQRYHKKKNSTKILQITNTRKKTLSGKGEKIDSEASDFSLSSSLIMANGFNDSSQDLHIKL